MLCLKIVSTSERQFELLSLGCDHYLSDPGIPVFNCLMFACSFVGKPTQKPDMAASEYLENNLDAWSFFRVHIRSQIVY